MTKNQEDKDSKNSDENEEHFNKNMKLHSLNESLFV
jgi:hypothetical protein